MVRPTRAELENDIGYVEGVLKNGAEMARAVASETLVRVRNAVGVGA